MNDIPAVVEYIEFDLNHIPPEITKSEDLKTYVLLKTQGGYVELIESPKIALTMFIFNIMHTASPALALKLNNASKYAIYDHQMWPVINPIDIDLSVYDKNDFSSFSHSDQEVTINIEDIWNSISEEDISKRVRKGLESVKSQVKITKKTTIVGVAPLLFILCTQHVVGNNTKQLFYRRSPSSVSRRVK